MFPPPPFFFNKILGSCYWITDSRATLMQGNKQTNKNNNGQKKASNIQALQCLLQLLFTEENQEV